MRYLNNNTTEKFHAISPYDLNEKKFHVSRNIRDYKKYKTK